jgi:hypothetical protein
VKSRTQYLRAYRERNRERAREEVLERDLLSNTAPSGECLIWQGAINSHGYGVVGVRGITYLVHRVTYELKAGEVPSGYDVHHVCGQRACCNPTHLEALSRRDHVRVEPRPWQEMGRKGAMVRWGARS